MTYHESFWVAVAAAAPVIALANTVAITDAFNVWSDAKLRRLSRTSKMAIVIICVGASGNLIFQGTSLYWALESLLFESDEPRVQAAVFDVVGGLAILFLIVFYGIMLRISLRHDERKDDKEKETTVRSETPSESSGIGWPAIPSRQSAPSEDARP